MSLNGLDDLKVTEAYNAASSEPGGWLLLKYATRDEIVLLEQGNGGVTEIRNAIANYEEPSPLFGFLRYRRRNVVIKYVPEDCSRLIQARATVHISAISDRFVPHETVFSISSPKELRDSALSAACSLHTASASTSSSSSSLYRQRLMEITEEEEEEIRAKRESCFPQELNEPASTSKVGSASGGSSSSKDTDLLSEVPPYSAGTTDSISSRKAGESAPEHSNGSTSREPHITMQSSNYDNPYSYSGRLKVKLGPRPSADAIGRLHTSAASPYRPVSTLPAGLRHYAKGSRVEKDQSKPISNPENANPLISNHSCPMSSAIDINTTTATTTQQLPPRSSQNEERPATSSSLSIRSIPSPALSTKSKAPVIDPARARLLRAQEIRKRRLEAAKEAVVEPVVAKLDRPEMTPPASPNILAESLSAMAVLDSLNKEEDTRLNLSSQHTKSDDFDDTQSDICPTFRAATSISEETESTPASSISESTKEAAEEDLSAVPPYHSQMYQTSNESELDKSNSLDIGFLSSLSFDNCVADSDLPLLLPSKPGKECRISNVTSPEKIPSESNFQILDDSSPSSPSGNTSCRSSMEVLNPENYIPQLSTENITNIQRASEEDSWDHLLYSRNVSERYSAQRYLKDRKRTGKENSVHDLTIKKEGSLTEGANHAITSQDMPEKTSEAKVSVDNQEDDGDSDSNFSSDDELMDELQSAIFEDAKPISVAKRAPVSPATPKSTKSNSETNIPIRASSNPLQKGLQTDGELNLPSCTENPRPLSTSSVIPNQLHAQPLSIVAKKVNLGSGISQRIKALERLSAIKPDSNINLGTTAGIPTFFSVRKASVRASSKNSIDNTNLMHGNTRPQSPSLPKIEYSGKSSGIVNHTERRNTIECNQSKPRQVQESISVTAHIVRDSRPSKLPSGASCDSVEQSALGLQESTLVIDRYPTFSSEETQHESLGPTSEKRSSYLSHKASKSRRSSFTVLKELFNERRTSTPESRRSTSYETQGQLQPPKPPSAHTTRGHGRSHSHASRPSNHCDKKNSLPPLQPSSSTSSSNNDRSEKKGSRTSRMLQFISSPKTTNWKTNSQIKSPSVPETAMSDVTTQSGPSRCPNDLGTATMISDVNVQFPDTLLWKRKTLFLDSQGYLIMAPAMSNHSNTTAKETRNIVASRRFHMNEFCVPFVPDVETEELPNSVILNFREGGEALQVACEDRTGQSRILSVLTQAHQNWTTS
ncbi:GPI-anchored cell surface glycoprotein [Blumeria hordei DH14]|uniref:GPI-anchored cell surface glycoprotein n=1 Tax=Blumeria graminis f. sp. hordei (strain DH14) TaxID=546991 RepID=N1J5I5_BLUG1|nr:GPI-anchored cell surface glycoprotein [Blumeria hordei DH14]